MAGSNVFSFLTGQRAVIYDEVHGDGRLGNLRTGSLRIFRITDRITNMDISDTEIATMDPIFASLTSTLFSPSNSYSLLMRTFFCFSGSYVFSIMASWFTPQAAVVDFADTDTSNVLIVVDGTDPEPVCLHPDHLGAGNVI